MTENELRIFREVSWDSGWNAALNCAVSLLRSKITREDATREDFAKQLDALKVGACVHAEGKGPE